jgi:hypothetical protein
MDRLRSKEISSFTIIKGSLISETYAAFQAWDFDSSVTANYDRFKRDNTVAARSANWLRDVVFVLHRRFDPIVHDRALVVLAQSKCALEVWKPILLWHMTRDEFLLRDFVVRWLAAEFESGRYAIRRADVIAYLDSLPAEHAETISKWTSSTKERLAGSLLHILADFGLLEGHVVKKFVPYHLPDESFLYILHAIAEQKTNARKAINSQEWRLFFMTSTEVEQTLFRLHQFRRVHYEVAGSIAQLQLPCASALEFAERNCA